MYASNHLILKKYHKLHFRYCMTNISKKFCLTLRIFYLLIPKINVCTFLLVVSYHSTFSTFIWSLLARWRFHWAWLDTNCGFLLKNKIRSHLKCLVLIMSLTITWLSGATKVGSTCTLDVFVSLTCNLVP